MSGSVGEPSSQATLLRDLVALGVEQGDTLFVHSSFKSIGPVAGGAGAVVSALEDAVGATGTILMPSFNLIDGTQETRARHWHIESSPSTVGWITEFFRTLLGTVRSDHPSHSVAARGLKAAAYVRGHRREEGMASPWDLAPWGRTYGSHSPMTMAYADSRAKLLMLGVGYGSSTFCHLVETMYWNRAIASDPGAEYRWIKREELGSQWEATSLGKSEVGLGFIGKARSRLFGIRNFVEAAFSLLQSDPDRWLK